MIWSLRSSRRCSRVCASDWSSFVSWLSSRPSMNWSTCWYINVLQARKPGENGKGAHLRYVCVLKLRFEIFLFFFSSFHQSHECLWCDHWVSPELGPALDRLFVRKGLCVNPPEESFKVVNGRDSDCCWDARADDSGSLGFPSFSSDLHHRIFLPLAIHVKVNRAI